MLIGAGASLLGAPPALSAARHGTRVTSGPVQRQTTAAMASNPVRATGPHAWPARRGEPAKHVATSTVTSSSPRFAGRAAGPRTAFGSTFDFPGPTLGTDTPTLFPPDTQGAVGPSQFLVTINGRFRSYDKSTGLADGAVNIAPEAFFSAQLSPKPTPTGSVFASDPHVRYDRLSQRWFIVMIDVPLDSLGNAFANRLLVAHSDGPVLSSSTVWSKTFIQVSGTFADYPTLGVDANALYVGTNNFSLSNGTFESTSGYVISKASVLGGGSVTATRFTLVATQNGAGPFTPQGADNPDPGASQGYFVGVDNAVFSQLDLVRVSDPGGSPTVSGNLTVSVPETTAPIAVPHLGNTGGASGQLDALDDRLFAASIRNNHLWTAHNIQVDASGAASNSGGRDGSRWYELNLGATPSLVQSGTVFDASASNPLSYWIPTVAVSGQGHMAIGGSVAGATRHADAWFSGRLSSDPLGSVDAPTPYTASTDAYNPPGDPGTSAAQPRRWGDYSAVSLDPVDDMTLWTIQEYVPAADTWGTRIARLRAPGPATPVGVTPRLLPGQASVPVTLTGSTSGGRGFFDPGPGFTRPQVSAGCGVAVTSVTVNGPGTVSLVLDTRGATGGSPCAITFTNPDGQPASADVLTFDRAPVAGSDAYSVAHDRVLNGSSVLANDTDPDGDPLTAAKASDPPHGTLTVNPNGTFTYTPAHGYTGPDTFTYTVSDGVLQGTGTVSIAVTNQAPVAASRSYSVLQGKVLSGSSLLAGDSDPDGDALTAARASAPAHGTVTVNPDGTFTYTPAPRYSGPDAFTYTAGDGVAQSTATAFISVTRRLTLTVRRLNGARLRVRVAGAGPDGAAVRVVVVLGTKRVAARSVRVVKGRWTLVLGLRRHGRYRFTASAAKQRAGLSRRL